MPARLVVEVKLLSLSVMSEPGSDVPRLAERVRMPPDGRVVSKYLGRGTVCECIDECTRGRRLERQLERRRKIEPIDAAVRALDVETAQLRTLATAYALATGHHSHKGQWRRRRGVTAPDGRPLAPLILTAPPDGAPPMPRKSTSRKTATRNKKPTPPAAFPPGSTLGVNEGVSLTVPDVPEAARADLARAVEEAKGSDPVAVTHLREVLLRFPSEAFSRSPSRMMALRKAAAITTGGGSATAFIEADTLRFADELVEPGDGPLVRAACETAALARVVHDQACVVYAREIAGGYLISTAEHLERRMTTTHTRYLRSMATVARLREMERREERRADRYLRTAGGTIRGQARAELERRKKARQAERERIALPAETPAHAGDGLPSVGDLELATG